MRAGLTIASIDTMCGGVAAIVVSCLLVKRMLPIHIAIDSVARVSGVKCLRVVVAQPEVMDILSETIDVIVLGNIASAPATTHQDAGFDDLHSACS